MVSIPVFSSERVSRVLNTPLVIPLVRTQYFPKKQHFLSPDMHASVYVSGGKKF